MIQGTIGFDKEILALLGYSAVIIGIMAVNAFWFSAGMLHKWQHAKVIRILWVVYVVAPLLVGGAYTWSIIRNPPLSTGSEQFVFGRGLDYFLYWLAFESLIAVCGTVAIIAQGYLKRKVTIAEQCTAPLPPPPAGPSEGAR